MSRKGVGKSSIIGCSILGDKRGFFLKGLKVADILLPFYGSLDIQPHERGGIVIGV